MKVLSIILPIFIFNLSAKAGTLSPCQKACYAAKLDCNINKIHTFNSCGHELFDCKANCQSGKRQESTKDSFPFEIAFQPILDLDR